jgi:aminoacrylate hydrolase
MTRRVDIGDAQLAVEICGDGPDVVCVSGLDGRAAFWRRQAGPLALHHRVTTFDARGSGRSTHSRIRYSVGQMAEDLVSLLDALDIETATIVGHGLGSGVALQLALMHTQRVERLVLGAAWAETSFYLTERLQLMQTILERGGPEAYALYDVMCSAPAAWLQDRPHFIRERADERVAGLAPLAVETSRLQAAIDCKLLARLPQVRTPTLLIAAFDDQVVPCTVARQVASAMPRARYEQLTTGGHWCPEVVPEVFSELLRKFLLE